MSAPGPRRFTKLELGAEGLYNENVALRDILTLERVSVANEAEGLVIDKPSALLRLSRLLASGHAAVRVEKIFTVLSERERLQSTGVGGGVGVPHGAIDELDRQIGALLICPNPIPFDAIDGEPVSILFALIGPKGAPAEHLKVLARASRLLRQEAFRTQLARSAVGSEAYDLVCAGDRGA